MMMQSIELQKNFEFPLNVFSIPSEGAKELNLTPETVEMLWVNSGEFVMGLECEHEDDFKVAITQGFWLSKYPITQGQWHGITRLLDEAYKNHPCLVTWEDLVIYFDLLNQKLGDKFPKGYHLGVVTEAQWEYVHRSGGQEKLLRDLSDEAYKKIGYKTDSRSHHVWEVGQKEPNLWGFHDMRGNHAEWCFDVFEGFPIPEDDDDKIFSENGIFQDWCANNWKEYTLRKYRSVDLHNIESIKKFNETLKSHFSLRISRLGGRNGEEERAYKYYNEPAMFRLCLRKKEPFDDSDLVVREIRGEKPITTVEPSNTIETIHEKKPNLLGRFWNKIKSLLGGDFNPEL